MCIVYSLHVFKWLPLKRKNAVTASTVTASSNLTNEVSICETNRYFTARADYRPLQANALPCKPAFIQGTTP